MPVVHVRANRVDAERAAPTLALIAEAVADAVPCDVDGVWCTFSALDVATDARLRAALAPHTTDAAVVIVAQRVSTIMRADQIVVLEDGEVVGIGTHTELLECCPTYTEIVESQMTREEAA
jgi:ABC-type phosphate transport system ATPase subunit